MDESKPSAENDKEFMGELKTALHQLDDVPRDKPKYHINLIQDFIEAKI